MNDAQTNQQEFLNRLRDVEMDVTVRFGVTEMPLRDVAALGGGSMIELNRTVDEPVELLINGLPFARGEVVVVDGYYSVRVTDVSPAEKNPNTFFAGSVPGGSEEEVTASGGDPVPTEPKPNPAPQQARPAAPAKPPQSDKPVPPKPQQQRPPDPQNNK